MLSEGERQLILYSMLYVQDTNIHPDVREHLWMRASGAAQLQETYSGYKSSDGKTVDYYETLLLSPTPAHVSQIDIDRDKDRFHFILKVKH